MWHHAMDRSMERRAIFIDDADAHAFLRLFGDVGERWGVWCHASWLISNHAYLLLHDEGGLLSRAMRYIDGVFTLFFNRRRGRCWDRRNSLKRGGSVFVSRRTTVIGKSPRRVVRGR